MGGGKVTAASDRVGGENAIVSCTYRAENAAGQQAVALKDQREALVWGINGASCQTRAQVREVVVVKPTAIPSDIKDISPIKQYLQRHGTCDTSNLRYAHQPNKMNS